MEQDNTKKWSTKKMLILGVLGYMIIGTLIRSSKLTPQQSSPSPSPSQTTVQEIKGKYMSYEYSVLFEAGKSQYVVTYAPFLPSNDTILTGAMLDSIGAIYGKNLVADLKPKIVEKNGTNVIQFTGTKANYYILPVKEDSGEIHSTVVWSE